MHKQNGVISIDQTILICCMVPSMGTVTIEVEKDFSVEN